MTHSSNLNSFDFLASLSPLESPGLRLKRAAFGALYGWLSGTTYVATVALVNPLTFPGLPIQVDVPDVAIQWALFGFGLALLGAWAAWPTEGWQGILGGALVTALLIVAINLQASGGSWTTGSVLLLLLSAPVAVLCLPIPLLLRWMARKSIQAVTFHRRSWVGQLLLWGLLAVVLGLTPGLFSRMSARAEIAVRQVQGVVQTAVALPPEAAMVGALAALPNVREHLDQPYGLSQQRSRISMEGFDVRVFFADGYAFTCVVVVYPSAGQQPFIRNCVEGRTAQP
jgi:hypothetical protein